MPERPDEFDRRLADRLRAYEAELPATGSPTPAGRPRRQRWPSIVAVAGTAVAAGALLGAVVLGLPRTEVAQSSPSPSVTTSATPGPSPTVTPSPPTSNAPSPTPSPSTANTSTPSATPTAELAWSGTGSFPSEEGHSMVEHVVRLAGEYAAVGVDYLPGLPLLGPTPLHEARAWISPDGRLWEPVQLGPGFENVTIGALVQRDDGSLLALGARGFVRDGFVDELEPAAWTTPDGVTWTEIVPPMEEIVRGVVQGPRGILGIVTPVDAPRARLHELWMSRDGVTWELVHSLQANYVELDAGDEGFVAVGRIGGEDSTPFAIASADGRDWVEAPRPAFGSFLEVASHGGDWFVTDDLGGTATVWFSANGLDWVAHDELPLRTVGVGDGACREYIRRVTSAQPWLVANTELAYPCSEGEFVIHGTQYISVDGAEWHALPLREGTPGETRSGSRVNDAVAADGGLILVGERDGAATFWFGEMP